MVVAATSARPKSSTVAITGAGDPDGTTTPTPTLLIGLWLPASIFCSCSSVPIDCRDEITRSAASPLRTRSVMAPMVAYCRMILWPDLCSNSPRTCLNTCWIEAADNTRNSSAFSKFGDPVSTTITAAVRAMIARAAEDIARLDQVMSAPPLQGWEQHLRQHVFKDRVAAVRPD